MHGFARGICPGLRALILGGLLTWGSVSLATHGRPGEIDLVLSSFDKGVNPLIRLAPGRFVPESTSLPPAVEIVLDRSERHHKILGYGAALTEASVIAINTIRPPQRQALLTRLFDPEVGAGFNFLRIPLGASDFIDRKKGFYTYDDTPGNQPDLLLQHFSMARDEKTIALLKEIQRINPELRVMLSPWSAPAWMKIGSVDGFINGVLNPMYEGVYAEYIARAVEHFEAEGIPVHAVTVVNEPYLTDNYEYIGMPMELDQQVRMIGRWLGPELERRGLKTRILALDHNYDLAGEATKIVEAPEAAPYIGGVGFHCYGGSPDMAAEMARRHPELRMYMTECTSLVEGHQHKRDPGGWLDGVIMHPEWSGALAWNMALFTPGSRPQGFTNCPECMGYVTVDPATGDYKIESDLIVTQHLSQFIRRGARPIGARELAPLPITYMAAENADGSTVFVANNRGPQSVKIRLRNPSGELFYFEIPGASVVTMTWR